MTFCHELKLFTVNGKIRATGKWNLNVTMINHPFFTLLFSSTTHIFLWLWAWICTMLNSGLLPSVLQTTITAFVTILIAVAIFLVDPDKEGKSRDFVWDLKVILKEVLRVKWLGFLLLGLILVLVFWSGTGSHNFFKAILLLGFFILCAFITGFLWNCYLWIEDQATEPATKHDKERFEKSFRNVCRNKFLDKNQNTDVWLSTWQDEIINPLAEQFLIEKFIENLDSATKEERREFVFKCLNNFNHFFDKRSLYDNDIFKLLFPKLLEWWGFYYDDEQALENQANDSILSEKIKYIIRELLERFIDDCLIKIKSLFKHLGEYTKGKEDKASVRALFKEIVCPMIFEIIEKNSGWDLTMWSLFPKGWKITYKNLADEVGKKKEHSFAGFWFDCFLHWAANEKKIAHPTSDYDTILLSRVVKELFPEVAHDLWEEILILIVRVHYEKEPAKSLIEKPKTGGFVAWSGFLSMGEYLKKEAEEKQKPTCKLAYLLFPAYFSQEMPAKYIKELEALDCKDDLSKQEHKQALLKFFKAMQTYVSEAK